MMMAERKNNTQDQDHAGGIKLFGATIMLQSNYSKIKEEEDEDEEEEELEEGEKSSSSSSSSDHQQSAEKRPDQKIIACPRCKSTDTKFCYFNNYNVNQPRHFCKGCQRYWTAGGALRNVPVGAGRRKTKPPSCRTFAGLPENCVFDSSGMIVPPFELEGMVEDWHVAAAHGGFRQILPVKRRRDDCQDGQTC